MLRFFFEREYIIHVYHVKPLHQNNNNFYNFLLDIIHENCVRIRKRKLYLDKVQQTI